MSDYFEKQFVRRSRSRDIEPHEIVLDRLARKKEEEWGISVKKVHVPLLDKTLRLFFIVLMLVMVGLFLKTFQLQVIKGKEYSELAYANKFIIKSIEAERGVIYDRNREQLVFNIPTFELICNRDELPDSQEQRNEVLHEVARILGADRESFRESIEQSEDSSVIVSQSLAHDDLVVLQTKIDTLVGFEIKKSLVRNYVDGSDYAHLIGYMGKIRRDELAENSDYYSLLDYVGRDGIEKYYEEVLRKNPGKLMIERDALGNVISQEIDTLPESGKSLVLHLDSGLQSKLNDVLKSKLYEVGSSKAVAVALDPKTGGILSMVSLPSFDNNVFSLGDSSAINRILSNKNEPLFNRVIAGRYPTGSTIKPLMAVAGLEEGLIDPDKHILCTGSLEVQDFWDPDKVWSYEDLNVHGWTDMRKAIAESCNVYFYRLGGGYESQEGIGPTKIKEYLSMFGWEDKTGVDLPGEVSGFIPDKGWKKSELGQGWWDGDTYNLSIGQGYLLITPLEVAASFVPIANKGTMYEPQAVYQVVDSDTKKVVEQFEPVVVKEGFVDSSSIQVVREGMRQAVTGYNSPLASSVLLSSLPVKAAAKTGTAETPKNNVYHNWITVFAPYDDPEIVLTIMVEDVYGVRAAVLPVAYEVLNWYFTR